MKNPFESLIVALAIMISFQSTCFAAEKSTADIVKRCQPEVTMAVKNIETDLIPYKEMFKTVIDRLDEDEKTQLRKRNKDIVDALAEYNRASEAKEFKEILK